ncbi:MAG: tRNA-intron lyase [Desulfurococcaceae archaeon]
MVCRGFLLYNRIIVPEVSCANQLYWTGYYGTFLGIQKPRNKEVKAPLELSLIEGLYLASVGALEVVDEHGKKLTLDELRKTATQRVEDFNSLHLVYADLRRRGFVVRKGLKFGCDFLVYRYGPGIDHAPFGVEIVKPDEEIDPIELVRIGRLLHSVKKKLLLAVPGKGTEEVRYLLLKWWKP